jgi:hypothetical protein
MVSMVWTAKTVWTVSPVRMAQMAQPAWQAAAVV